MAGAAGAPAYANSTVVLEVPDQLVLPSGPAGGQDQGRTLDLRLHPSDPRTTARGRVTVDTSELSGVAKVTWPAACTPEGDGAECDLPHSSGQPDDTAVLLLTAAPGAHAGAAGVIRFTGHAPGSPDVRGQTRVTVGSGADVYMHELPQRLSAKPGDTVPLPFVLTNRGGDPGAGSILTAVPSPGLDTLPRYGNCLYEANGLETPEKVSWIVCVLPPVAPGASASYRGLPFTVRNSALIEDVDTATEPYTPEALATARGKHTMVQGTGEDLAPYTTGSQDYPPGDDGADVRIDVDNTAELALTAPPPLRGAKGAVVEAEVTLTNQGPADHLDGWNETPTASIDFRPPPGTTVIDPDDGCRVFDAHGRQSEPGTPGARYTCPVTPYLWAGQSRVEVFRLRIDRVIPNAAGSAAIDPVPAYDRNQANNRVRIVLDAETGDTPTGGGTSGGTGHGGGSGHDAGSPGTHAAGSTGGSGPSSTGGTASGAADGDLAATGTDPVGLIGAVAMGCGLFGGWVVLLLRSRRRPGAGRG
ncbi:hypothetical protein [Streptomyces sp. NPDC049040]|uniref:hypothetical protein n=1 Tax=Streptomyces sp. NPDC049040 TaxID=3365593 RepID=UPI00371B2A63